MLTPGTKEFAKLARIATRAQRNADKIAASSAVIYEGPSLLDGNPIIVVAIVREGKAQNRKTGAMVQTYILRADSDPVTASRMGDDSSVCGQCPLRGFARPNAKTGTAGARGCYVFLGQGPLIVYRSYIKGVYRRAHGHAAIAAIGAGRLVRIGTYGDGAAVPSYVFESLLSRALGHTAYSHQSGNAESSYDANLYMISAGSESEARAAWANGARTFRVVQNIAEIIKGAEILCPASKEAGARVTCAQCKLCGGASVKAKSIAIVAHGAGAKYSRAA